MPQMIPCATPPGNRVIKLGRLNDAKYRAVFIALPHKINCLIADCGVVAGDGDVELGGDVCVVLLDGLGVVFNGHLGNI